MARLVVWGGSLALLVLAGCRFDAVGPDGSEPMTLVAGDRAGNLYTVEEATGRETFLRVAAFHDPIGGNVLPLGPIVSMSWVPGQDSWWVATARAGGCPSCIASFRTDATQARLVRAGIFEVDTLADFAVHPFNGRVYTLKKAESGYLFRVDTRNGQFDEVMGEDRLFEGAFGKGATYASDGFLYVAGGDRLTRIRVNRIEATLVGTLTYVGFPAFRNYSVTLASLATRPTDGLVFALVEDGGGAATTVTATYIATVDLETAVVTNVGATTTLLSALAFVPTRLAL